MKYYVQFTEINCLTGKTVDAMGSDGICVLDGRNNLETMVRDSIKRAWMLRKIHNYNGFKIMKGDLKSATCIYTAEINTVSA